MKTNRHPCRRLGVLATAGLLLTAALPIGAVAVPPELPVEYPVPEIVEGNAPLAGMLARLSELLQTLEGDLAALEGARAERLEERLEEAIEAIEGLLDTSGRPGERLDERAWKARLTTVDLRLHRLVHLLEEMVEGTPDRPQRPRALGSVEQLRTWVDEYVAEASKGMNPEEKERFERSVHRMARFLGERISEMAKKANEKPEHPRLERLVERLEELLFRLDGILLRGLPRKE